MNYKQINENWQRYINEDVSQVRTIGQLRDVLAKAQSHARAEKGKGVLKDTSKEAVKNFLASWLGPVGGALSATATIAQAAHQMYMAPDKATKGTAMDHLNVDDKVSAIVDDPLEVAFLKWWVKDLEGMSDNVQLSQIDVDQKLADWIFAGHGDLDKFPPTPKTEPTLKDMAE